MFQFKVNWKNSDSESSVCSNESEEDRSYSEDYDWKAEMDRDCDEYFSKMPLHAVKDFLKRHDEEVKLERELMKNLKIVEAVNPCSVTLASSALRTAKATTARQNNHKVQQEKGPQEDLDAVRPHQLSLEENKDFVGWYSKSGVKTRG